MSLARLRLLVRQCPTLSDGLLAMRKCIVGTGMRVVVRQRGPCLSWTVARGR